MSKDSSTASGSNLSRSLRWCLFELLVRILAGMLALDMARPEDIVPLILRRDPRFTRLAIVEGLTDIGKDINGSTVDRFGTFSTYDATDKAMIKQRIVEQCGSPAAFNLLVSSYRAAGIQHHRQVRRGPARCGRRCGGGEEEWEEPPSPAAG